MLLHLEMVVSLISYIGFKSLNALFGGNAQETDFIHVLWKMQEYLTRPERIRHQTDDMFSLLNDFKCVFADEVNHFPSPQWWLFCTTILGNSVGNLLMIDIPMRIEFWWFCRRCLFAHFVLLFQWDLRYLGHCSEICWCFLGRQIQVLEPWNRLNPLLSITINHDQPWYSQPLSTIIIHD